MPEQYLYAEETHKIIHALYYVYNELGFGYQEKYYCRALKIKLEELRFLVQEQVPAELKISGKSIGRYFLDFLINNKIILEIKVAEGVYHTHIRQVIGYLTAHNLHVGLIGVFSPKGMLIKRLVN